MQSPRTICPDRGDQDPYTDSVCAFTRPGPPRTAPGCSPALSRTPGHHGLREVVAPHVPNGNHRRCTAINLTSLTTGAPRHVSALLGTAVDPWDLSIGSLLT